MFAGCFIFYPELYKSIMHRNILAHLICEMLSHVTVEAVINRTKINIQPSHFSVSSYLLIFWQLVAKQSPFHINKPTPQKPAVENNPREPDKSPLTGVISPPRPVTFVQGVTILLIRPLATVARTTPGPSAPRSVPGAGPVGGLGVRHRTRLLVCLHLELHHPCTLLKVMGHCKVMAMSIIEVSSKRLITTSDGVNRTF